MKKIIFSLALSLVGLTTGLEACTGVKLVAEDGKVINGRTLEFGIIVDVSVDVVPKGYSFKGTTPKGEGLTYSAKYGAVGASAFGVPALMDGINEKGLSVGTFYFPTFAEYADITAENQSKALSPVEFSNWLLTQFATVEDVKNGLEQVVIAPTVTKEWGNAAPPFHYIVYDKSGKSLVIEPIKGKLVTYDNQLGTFTNSPSFDWHMLNLRNYINLTPFNAKPVTLNGLTFEPFSMGAGMVGLPGDFSSPSRFVRAAIFSSIAIPSKTSDEAVFQLFHILNQFDIPVGVVREKEGGLVYSDETQLTCVKDPQSLKYYFRTYQDQTIKVVDLTKFDLNAKEIKSFRSNSLSPVVDVTAQVK